MANSQRAALPGSEAEVLIAAKALDLPIPEACMEGVMANLALLRIHAAILADDPAPGAR